MGLHIRLGLAGILAVSAIFAGILLSSSDDAGTLSLFPAEEGAAEPGAPRRNSRSRLPEHRAALESTPIATIPLPADTTRLPSGPGSILGIVKTPDGKPAAAAEVSIRLIGGSRLNKKVRRKLSRALLARSTAEGRFYFRGLPAGTWRIDVNDGKRSLLAPQNVKLSDESRQAEVELQLHAGLELAGVMKDHAGKPIEGARLELKARKASKGGSADPLKLRSAVTDAAGRFRFAGLRTDAPFKLTAKHDRHYMRKGHRSFVMGRDTRLDLELAAFAILAGSVRTPDGSPAGGALVELLGRPEVTADAAGRFTVSGIKARGKTMSLLAATPDLDLIAHDEVLLLEGQSRDDVVVTLHRSARIRGRVTDVHGVGIPGAQVAATGRGESKSSRTRHAIERINFAAAAHVQRRLASSVVSIDFPSPSRLSPAAGAFFSGDDLPGLSSLMLNRFQGLAQVQASAAVRGRVVEWSAAELTNIMSPGTGLLVVSPQINGDGRVALSMQDGSLSTSSIVIHAAEWISVTDSMVSPLPRSPLSQRLSNRRSTVTDPEGLFEIRGLTAGRYSVTATRHRFYRKAKEIVDLFRSGDVHDVNLLLHRSAEIRGHISRGDGVKGGTFEIKVRNIKTGLTRSVRQSGSGKFVVKNLPGGSYELMAGTQPKGDLVCLIENMKLELDEIEDGLILELSPGARISGEVRDREGVPVVGAKVKVISLQKRGSFHARTGPQGLYELRGLLPGKYRVEIRANGFILHQKVMRLAPQGQELLDVALVKTTTLRGVVSVPAGVPLKAIYVFLHMSKKTQTATTDSQGRFRFKGVVEGPCTIYSRTKDQVWNTRVVMDVNSKDSQVELSLYLRRCCTARGRVVDGQGIGVPGLTVRATSADNPRVKREGKTGPNGFFVVGDLYEGTYVLRVNGRKSTRKTLTVRTAAPPPSVTILLKN